MCPRAYGHANMNDTSKVHLLLSLKENKQVKFNKVSGSICRLKRLENLKGASINSDGEQQGNINFCNIGYSFYLLQQMLTGDVFKNANQFSLPPPAFSHSETWG